VIVFAMIFKFIRLIIIVNTRPKVKQNIGNMKGKTIFLSHL
jgi:hypothetical protein